MDSSGRFFLLLFFLLFVLVVCSFLVLYSCFERSVPVSFSDDVVEGLNQYFFDTPRGVEFVAYLYVDGGLVNDFSVYAYKNLTSGAIDIVDRGVVVSNYTVHNHENGICQPSRGDLVMDCDFACIICGEDKIKCFLTHQGVLNND